MVRGVGGGEIAVRSGALRLSFEITIILFLSFVFVHEILF